MPRMITIRASSLSELFDCPARWESKHIHGKFIPKSGAAQLGTAVHAGAAVFDSSVLLDTGVTVDEAAGAVVDAIHKPEYDVFWDDEKPSDAEKIALSLHKKYCTEISPKQSYAAVEVACDRLEITDLGIALTGTVDRVHKYDDGYGICDIKTGKQVVSVANTVNIKGNAYQLGVYELLADVASGLPISQPAKIIGLNTAKTEAAQRTAIGEVSGARDILMGDENRTGVLEIASRFMKSGSFYGNPRSMLCHEKFCPIFNTCNFRR